MSGSAREIRVGVRLPERWHPVTRETEEHLVKWDIGRTVHRVLERVLTPREEYVINRRFGIGQSLNIQMPAAEIARRLGVSRSRAHQILHRAIRKLRTPRAMKDLRVFDDDPQASPNWYGPVHLPKVPRYDQDFWSQP